jgi:membrane associated rhomboid family serine protease
VLLYYGSILFGAIPVMRGCGGVSWQGHLTGDIAGVLAAYWLSKPERAARAARTTAPPSGQLR